MSIRRKPLPRQGRRPRPCPAFEIVEESFFLELKTVPNSIHLLAYPMPQRPLLERNSHRSVTESTKALVASLAGSGYSTVVGTMKRAYQSMAGSQERVHEVPDDGIELAWMSNINRSRTRLRAGKTRKCWRCEPRLSNGIAGEESLCPMGRNNAIQEGPVDECEDDNDSEEDTEDIIRVKRKRTNSFPQTTHERENISYVAVLDRVGDDWIHALSKKHIADFKNDTELDESLLKSDDEVDVKVNVCRGDLDNKEFRTQAGSDLDTSNDDTSIDNSILGAAYISFSTFDIPTRNSTFHNTFATSRGVGSHIYEILERLRQSGAEGENGREEFRAGSSSRKPNSATSVEGRDGNEADSEPAQTHGWDIFEMIHERRAWDGYERSADWDGGAESEDGSMNSTFTDDEDNDDESQLTSLGTSYQEYDDV